MNVYRCYSAKKPQYDVESTALLDQLWGQLGIDNLENLFILHRYDVEGISQEVFERAKGIVFSEPQVDNIYNEDFSPARAPEYTLAVEALPYPAHGRGGAPPGGQRNSLPFLYH